MPTKIDWTDETWNITTGCTKISPGCRNCYAEQMTARLQAMGVKKYAAGFDTVVCHPAALETPLHWKKPRRVFVDSMSDLFHGDVPDTFVARVIQVIADCPDHMFQVLTKRPQRALRWFHKWWNPARRHKIVRGRTTHMVPNLWLRVSGCSECRYHFLGCLRGRKKWKDKAKCPNRREATARDWWGYPQSICDGFEWASPGNQHGVAVELTGGEIGVREEALSGPFPAPLKNLWLGTTAENQEMAVKRMPELLKIPAALRFLSAEPLLGHFVLPSLGFTGPQTIVDWVIIGCESGANRRPFDNAWAESIAEQCSVAGVPVFVKQLRDERDNVVHGPAEWDGWPEWAVQEFPETGKAAKREDE